MAENFSTMIHTIFEVVFRSVVLRSKVFFAKKTPQFFFRLAECTL